jgi:DNA-binding NtrC family response regulator
LKDPLQSSLPSILLVDDSEDFRRSLIRALRSSYNVSVASSREEALQKLVPPPQTVLLDLRLSEDDETSVQALDLLQRLRKEYPQISVIMITAYGDVDTAVECMRLGAADFIQKDSEIRVLKARIEKALEAASLSSRLLRLEAELAIVEPRKIVGISDAICEIKEMIAAVARDGQTSVLINGETGTGKELVARSIHASGPRSSFPFVGVALAALPSTTVEAELFGHEPGAFTDARRQNLGLIERAHRGVLFLDEIGELEPAIQVKLLRFLEERIVRRLGGQLEIPVDVQILAATNADLPRLIREGQFREDLYYRLKVCEIALPPLRTLHQDIPALIDHYLTRLGGNKGIRGVSKEALRALVQFRWPGNVRELRNALESAVVRAGLRRHLEVELEDLPEDVRVPAERTHEASDFGHLDEPPIALEEALARTELEQVEAALLKVHGKKAEAWKLLGLNDRYVFSRRIRRLFVRFPALVEKYPAVKAAFSDNGKK